MALLLKIVGGGWALVGLANIVLMPWDGGSEGVLTFGLIFNGVLFLLPGLVVYGIGARMTPPDNKEQKEAIKPEAAKKTSETRLSELNDLKERGLISEDEYQSRRTQILDDV